MSVPTLKRAVRDGVPGWLHESGRFLPAIAGADPAADALKDKLKRVEDDIAQLRTDRADAARKREEAKKAFAEAEDYSTDGDAYKAAEAAVKAVGEIDDRINEAQNAQVGILKMLGQQDPAEREKRREQRDTGKADEAARWNSAEIFKSDELRQQLTRAATTKSHVGPIELGQVIDRDAFKADVTGTTNMRLAPFAGIVPQVFRRLRLLDLIPAGTTDGNSVPYTQESGTFLAAETLEGAAKPEDGVVFTDVTAPVQTIAGWQKVRKQALADFPALQAMIDGRLRYSVQRRLEGQILNGNGTDPNLRGILNTTGIGTVTFTAGNILGEQLLKGITNTYLADGEANAVVANPTDWQSIMTAKTSGSGDYYGDGPFAPAPVMIWGVPVIPSPVVAAGTALVGDFQMGATLLIREGVNVLLSDSDQDDFIRNRVTILGELRAALLVWRPAMFQKVALA